MTEPLLSPDPPTPPGVPRIEDLDVPEPVIPRDIPRTQDVREEAGAIEPPD
ncbi:hypothetical protein [Actinophytocola sp.]|uniref:hypothetical protein n=1 Tax=Actinophytocola sp. TaxID=1872138 RepID=UPI00389AA7D9